MPSSMHINLMDSPFWTIEIQIPLDSDSLQKATNVREAIAIGQIIEKLVGRECNNSGCGCGFRDMDWTFETEQEATAFREKLLQALGRIDHSVFPQGITVNTHFTGLDDDQLH